jgi:hypothetical protein
LNGRDSVFDGVKKAALRAAFLVYALTLRNTGVPPRYGDRAISPSVQGISFS